ncbi:MAG: hypothetical protein V1922_05295 [bacterium]
MQSGNPSPREKIRLKYFDLMHGTTAIDGLGILASDKETFTPYFEDKHIRKIIDEFAPEEDKRSIYGWETVAKSIIYYDLLAVRQYYEYLSLLRSGDIKERKKCYSSLLLYLNFTMEVVANWYLLGLSLEYSFIPPCIESIRLIPTLYKGEAQSIPLDVLDMFRYMGVDLVKNIENINSTLQLRLIQSEIREIQAQLWEWCKDIHLTLRAYSVP